ncbi:hypothetical protein ACLOJK_022111 [Asimina triloba]
MEEAKGHYGFGFEYFQFLLCAFWVAWNATACMRLPPSLNRSVACLGNLRLVDCGATREGRLVLLVLLEEWDPPSFVFGLRSALTDNRIDGVPGEMDQHADSLFSGVVLAVLSWRPGCEI